MIALNQANVVAAQAESFMARIRAGIPEKAHLKAQADFAAWLMIAKLNGFDELPANAQTWLTNYRTRLQQMPDSDAAAATIQEIYAAYYRDMGGTGVPPKVEPNSTRSAEASDNVVRLKEFRTARSTRTDASPKKKPVPALLIFAGLVAVVVAVKFLMQ